MNKQSFGRVTIPTDLDVVPETLEILKKWGADAIRDCDGTDFPVELQGQNAKIYSTYYTTRKDNAWAKANPDEVQQSYLMTPIHTAEEGSLSIELMKGISREMMEVNARDDIKRWWEVMDRTTGEPLSPDAWHYDGDTGCVVIPEPAPYHNYTVAFLAYIIWDPVHMYNAVTNNWQNFEHQITFDVRQPKTHKFTMERLRKFIQEHPYVNVIRYTTFFHQFTLVFDELRREKFVDWYGYSSSVSPCILEQFEKEVGYQFRPEFIVDQGYHNNQYRIPSKEYKDFQAFQRREVARLCKEMVDITHECGLEAMMFLGDHWIGTEPYGRVENHRRGRGGRLRGQRLYAAADLRYPRRQIHRGSVPALFLPGHLPRGRRSCERSQRELGHRPPGDSPEAHRPHRLRRLSEAGAGISGVCGLH